MSIKKKYPSKEEALEMIFNEWTPTPESETVQIENAIGRVSAEDALSVNTIPVVRASSADGIACSYELFRDGHPDSSRWQEGIEFERADTGDDFPDKYDMVIRIEDVEFLEDGGIEISKSFEAAPGTNISPAGKTVMKGDLVLPSHTKIKPNNLAALATGGIEFVKVLKKPKVAFIPTGSELIPHGTVPQRGQNIDSNSLMIKHMLIEMGVEPIIFPIVKDINANLDTALERALEFADIVIINAGSSKGKEDLNTALIRKKGRLLQHRVAAAPGFPIGIGIVEDKPVINLPGPNVAAFYGCEWCIKGIVSKYYSLNADSREKVEAVLQGDLRGKPDIAYLCKMDVFMNSDGEYMAFPKSHKSGKSIDASRADAYYISPLGSNGLKKGDRIMLTLLTDKSDIKIMD